MKNETLSTSSHAEIQTNDDAKIRELTVAELEQVGGGVGYGAGSAGNTVH
jgi:hypothetical protein